MEGWLENRSFLSNRQAIDLQWVFLSFVQERTRRSVATPPPGKLLDKEQDSPMRHRTTTPTLRARVNIRTGTTGSTMSGATFGKVKEPHLLAHHCDVFAPSPPLQDRSELLHTMKQRSGTKAEES